MQMAEAAGTEGDPRNTRAPFRLQDFMCFKISKRYTVLLLLVLLAFPVKSNETSKQITEHPSSMTPSAASLGMCAVCPEPHCATLVSGIWLEGNDERILWNKKDEEIPQCFNDNLKSDKPCQMPNGNLVLRTVNKLEFEWKNLTSHDAKLIISVNMSCAKLNLSSSSTPSPRVPHLAPMTKAPIHNTSTPAAQKDSVADEKRIIIGSVIGSIFGIGGIILIGFLIWKLRNCRNGGGDRRPDENDAEMGLVNGKAANGNVNGVH